MSLFELVLLAVGLSMDATAIAVTRGFAAEQFRWRDAALLAAFFGGAQAVMPAFGWLAGEALATKIVGWGQWITFGVFAVLGGKMIYEALRSSDNEGDGARADPFALGPLFVLAVATSIDALAAGVTISVRHVAIGLACAVIGTVTAALSFAGVFAGRRFGASLGKRLDIVGGIVLLALAAKALVERP
jgi:putative Mn2+ efflux pump MntP